MQLLHRIYIDVKWTASKETTHFTNVYLSFKFFNNIVIFLKNNMLLPDVEKKYISII